MASTIAYAAASTAGMYFGLQYLKRAGSEWGPRLATIAPITAGLAAYGISALAGVALAPHIVAITTLGQIALGFWVLSKPEEIPQVDTNDHISLEDLYRIPKPAENEALDYLPGGRLTAQETALWQEVEVLYGSIQVVGRNLRKSHNKIALHVAANYAFHFSEASGVQAGGVRAFMQEEGVRCPKKPHETDYWYLEAQFKEKHLGKNPGLYRDCVAALPAFRDSSPEREAIQTYITACKRAQRDSRPLTEAECAATVNALVAEGKYEDFYRAIIALHRMKKVSVGSANYIGLFDVMRQKTPSSFLLYHSAAPNFRGDWRITQGVQEAVQDDAFISDAIYSSVYKMLKDADKERCDALVLTPAGTGLFRGSRDDLTPYARGMRLAINQFKAESPGSELKIYLNLFKPNTGFEEAFGQVGQG